MLTATGGWLKQNGYEIRVLNLVNLEQSDGYNQMCIRDRAHPTHAGWGGDQRWVCPLGQGWAA